jgi:AcrR family transcriptional regulator
MTREALSRSKRRRISRAERAEQLLDVTLEMIGERGYEAVSVQAIADAAGITKPIIYRIYPSVHALLLALFRREQRRTDAALDAIIPRDPGDRVPADVVIDSLAGLLRSVAAFPLTWRLILFPAEGAPAPLRALVERRRENVVRRARRLVRWGIPYLMVDELPDEDLVARMLVSWAEEHARIVLEDETVSIDHLIGSARALLKAVAWR